MNTLQERTAEVRRSSSTSFSGISFSQQGGFKLMSRVRCSVCGAEMEVITKSVQKIGGNRRVTTLNTNRTD